jgi:hypothetical protein
MSDPKGGDASPAKKYRLRVDVAKPAELYKPSFGTSRTSPGTSGRGTPLVSFPGTPLAPDDSRPVEPAMLRASEGGKRNRKPVDRMPAGGIDLTPTAAASTLDKGGGDGNNARMIQRILSRRVHEGGSTSYLIVWGNGHVTNATWHSRASLGEPRRPPHCLTSHECPAPSVCASARPTCPCPSSRRARHSVAVGAAATQGCIRLPTLLPKIHSLPKDQEHKPETDQE